MQQIKLKTNIPSSSMEASMINADNCSTKSNSPESSSSVQTKDMDFKGQIHSYSIGQNFVKENTGYIKDFYKISSSIGKGAFGEVRKCLHKESKALRAVKIINKKHLAKEERERLVGEINILKTLDHPNILKLYEFFQDSKRFFLVTELCSGGELFDKIAEEQYFSERDAAKVIKQILSAVNYCHQKNVVHRDLKPENILMNRDVHDPKITIIDFGTSGSFNRNEKMSQKYGTPYYIAPEVLNNNYDEKCDIWSIGVILFILLCGYPPFNGAHEDEIIERVQTGYFCTDDEDWDDISPAAKDLVHKLLAYNPKERISAAEAIQHPWIKELSKGDLDEKVTRKTLINIRNFSSSHRLKQAVLAFIATHLSRDEEKKDLDKIFKAIDIDGDGSLSRQEMMQGYEEHFGIPISEEQVEDIFRKIDLDGSGTIDYTEFTMATVNETTNVTVQRLKMAFQMIDKDQNGSLSPEEIKEFLCFDAKINPKEVEAMIAEADQNGDGEIQFDEFKDMMTILSQKVK